jgi:hypothetical protein
MNNAVGARVINDETVERRILDQLAKAPPQGFARWHDKRGPDSRPKLSHRCENDRFRSIHRHLRFPRKILGHPNPNSDVIPLCELFGIEFCALFGIIGTYSRTRHGRTGIAGSIRSRNHSRAFSNHSALFRAGQVVKHQRGGPERA